MTETANWAWQARDGDGELRRGTLAAENAAEVASRLRSEGRIVISIDRSVIAPRSSEGRAFNIPGRVDREATASIIRRLSVMLEAGVPLPEALAIEVESTPVLATELDQIREAVEGGAPPSEAFAEHPRSRARRPSQHLRCNKLTRNTICLLSILAGARKCSSVRPVAVSDGYAFGNR